MLEELRLNKISAGASVAENDDGVFIGVVIESVKGLWRKAILCLPGAWNGDGWHRCLRLLSDSASSPVSAVAGLIRPLCRGRDGSVKTGWSFAV